MTNNYPSLVKVGQEPEYKKNSPLKISSIGTEIKKGNFRMEVSDFSLAIIGKFFC